jgi:protein SCO1/2
MWPHGLLVRAGLFGWLISICVGTAAEPLSSSEPSKSNDQSFAARGVVKKLDPGNRTVLVSHEAITNYMDRMTMPFKVKDPRELTGLGIGDRISFRLHVTETESWIGQVSKIGTVPLDEARQPDSLAATERPGASHPLLAFKFTNELGKAVSLDDFRGQALAITFFFTRCPIPDYCPRLSKNFEEASRKLSSLASGPTNWHFLSVSFDTEFDNPRALKAYAEMYHYDPAHWSFLTGPADKIGELARLSDATFARDGGSFNHNFRTLIIDPTGHLQTVFPTGGNLSGAIVDEMLKAVAVTNGMVSQNPARNELGKHARNPNGG